MLPTTPAGFVFAQQALLEDMEKKGQLPHLETLKKYEEVKKQAEKYNFTIQITKFYGEQQLRLQDKEGALPAESFQSVFEALAFFNGIEASLERERILVFRKETKQRAEKKAQEDIEKRLAYLKDEWLSFRECEKAIILHTLPLLGYEDFLTKNIIEPHKIKGKILDHPKNADDFAACQKQFWGGRKIGLELNLMPDISPEWAALLRNWSSINCVENSGNQTRKIQAILRHATVSKTKRLSF